MHIAYIGKLNQTNGIIAEMLKTDFEAEIRFFDFQDFVMQAQVKNLPSYTIIIIDINTCTGSGTAPDKIKKLSELSDSTPILVFHSYEGEKFIQPLIDAGARGIMPSTPNRNELAPAVSTLLEGKNFFRDRL